MKKIIITLFALLVWMVALPCVHAEEDFRVLALNKFGEPYKKFVFDNEEAWAYKGSPEKITIQGLEISQFTLYRFGKKGELHSKYTVDENYVKDLETNGPKILNKFVGAVVGEGLDDRIYISEATLDVIKAKKAASGTKGPPVDLNKPVENPALKTAIIRWKKQPTAGNHRDLDVQLNSANFLVPIVTDKMKTKPTNNTGQVIANKGSIIEFMSYRGSNRLYFLPVCTDWNEIKLFTSQNINTLVMTPSQLWSFIMKDTRQNGYRGIIINPGSDKIELSTKDVALLEKQRREAH